MVAWGAQVRLLQLSVFAKSSTSVGKNFAGPRLQGEPWFLKFDTLVRSDLNIIFPKGIRLSLTGCKVIATGVFPLFKAYLVN